MRRLRLLPFILILLIAAACGRTDISITPVPTRVIRPTAAAVLPTDVGSEPAAETTAEALPVITVTTAPLGDAVRGATLFQATYNTAQGPWACSLCHYLDGQRLVGPGLGNLRERFPSYGLAEPIENYVHNSILHPNDFIVPADSAGPYPPNLMPQNYAELLSAQDVDDLAAYILSLGG